MFHPQETESLTVPIETAALERYAKDCANLVEVGVAHGGTSKLLRKVMSPMGRLNLVDPFEITELRWGNKTWPFDLRETIKNVEVHQNGVVRWYICTSVRAAQRINEPLDFVFIDGNHTEEGATQDFALWGPKIIPGGYLLFHDVATWHPGVWAAYNNVIKGSPGWNFVEHVHSLLVMQKA